MEIKIRTLTPIWTGGVQGTVDRIYETGIIGSLRWWLEVFVRGVGGQACDPSEHSCICDPQKPNHGLCDVCQIFGATGWRRRFRLSVVDQTQPDTSSPKQISANRTNPKTKKNATWWFPDYPRSGNLDVKVQSLTQDFPCEIIGGLLQFVADWAALGARAQMGFGVIEPLNGRCSPRALYEWLVGKAGSHTYLNLPTLRNLFLARIHLNNAKGQDTFNLKCDLRRLFAEDKGLRHFILGTIKEGRIAGKVKISRPYGDGLMRVWGWIPEEASVYSLSLNQNSVVSSIHQHMKDNYDLQVWREINSTRDTVAPSNSDIQAFLRSLFEIEEEDHAA